MTRPAESPPATKFDDSMIPLTRVDTGGFTDNHLEEYGITADEAAFMKAVVKAMNGELEGYNLRESMTNIKSLYEVNEDRLLAHGYLKRHTGVARRCYYTVTAKGQKACRMAKKHGFGVGDTGDDTPHRVGVELAREYYDRRDDVRFIEISPREGGSRTDLVVVGTDSNRVATVEVEGGRISADPGVPDDVSAGINDYSSIRHDYHVLADADGESVWVVRNNEIAANVLRALSGGADIPVTVGRDTAKGIETGRIKIDEFNETVEGMDADGLDAIVTFQQLRNRL